MEWVIFAVMFFVFLAVNQSTNASISSRLRAEIRRLEQKIDGLEQKVGTSNSGQNQSFSTGYTPGQISASPSPEPANPWESRESFTRTDYTGFGQPIGQPSNQGGPVSSRVGVQVNFNGGGQYVLPPEVEELVRQGQKIQAIKLVREQTNLGLKDAKDLVEVYERQYKQGY